MAGWGLLFAVMGCSPSREDSQFRVAVIPVLKEAAWVDTALEEIADTYPAPAESIALAFRQNVSELPAPKDKALRYLRMRLSVLGNAIVDEVRNEDTRKGAKWLANYMGDKADSTLLNMDSQKFEEGMKLMRRYLEDYEVAAVAERRAIGTSLLWDRLNTYGLSAPSDSIGAGAMRSRVAARDSVYRARDAFVNKELKSFR